MLKVLSRWLQGQQQHSVQQLKSTFVTIMSLFVTFYCLAKMCSLLQLFLHLIDSLNVTFSYELEL